MAVRKNHLSAPRPQAPHTADPGLTSNTCPCSLRCRGLAAWTCPAKPQQALVSSLPEALSGGSSPGLLSEASPGPGARPYGHTHSPMPEMSSEGTQTGRHEPRASETQPPRPDRGGLQTSLPVPRCCVMSLHTYSSDKIPGPTQT